MLGNEIMDIALRGDLGKMRYGENLHTGTHGTDHRAHAVGDTS